MFFFFLFLFFQLWMSFEIFSWPSFPLMRDFSFNVFCSNSKCFYLQVLHSYKIAGRTNNSVWFCYSLIMNYCTKIILLGSQIIYVFLRNKSFGQSLADKLQKASLFFFLLLLSPINLQIITKALKQTLPHLKMTHIEPVTLSHVTPCSQNKNHIREIY